MKILLVEPAFPVPAKSKNHKDFLPIGLLKIGAHFKARKGVERIELARGNREVDYTPDRIFVTSLFTYWSKHFWDSVEFYREQYPKATIQVGGIYVSLFYHDAGFRKRCRELRVKPWKGVLKYAEKQNGSDYSLLHGNPHPPNYQIVHSSRGCSRRCDFCGTWKIEPRFEEKKSISDEVRLRRLVFYDNNLLANSHIESILNELIDLKKRRKILWCESQSGFDGRILSENPHLGEMIKNAGFRYPRIAWDWGYQQHPRIKEQIDILVSGGYSHKDIFVFMIFNWNVRFREMEKKRIKCLRWKVQISDCRFRPLDQTYDGYDPRKTGQTNDDYHLHKEGGWSDKLVKQFRKNVRRQNICVRHGFPFYSKDFERKKVDRKLTAELKQLKTLQEKEEFLEERDIHHWFPDRITYPPKERSSVTTCTSLPMTLSKLLV